VPADKVQYILSAINEVLLADKATNRQLASIAGMLMSISAAVHMAPLYTRTLYHALDSSTGWDGAAGNLSMARDDLQH
jgi:ubiquinone biosynthesis protein UbiJ